MKKKLLGKASIVAIAVMLLGVTGILAIAHEQSEEPIICGEPEIFTLWGGKTIDVGSVTVSNDEDNLYVRYETSGDWYLTEVQLYVLDYEPTERLPPGLAPYKSGDISYATSYTFTVPLSAFEVECGVTALWLQAHAAVVKMVDGEIVQGETAYGGDITDPDTGSWYGNIMYVVQCCDDEPPEEEEECWQDETAWAANGDTPGEIRYTARGNWATYVEYFGEEKTVKIFAGQTMYAGTATFSAPDNGEVTITINLDNDFIFYQDDPDNPDDNLKVQDYEEAPSGNPAPGLFDWKMSVEFGSITASITVPENNFYGVHLDVAYPVPCESECDC